MVEGLDIYKVTEMILRLLTEDKVVNNMPRMMRGVFYPEMLRTILDMHSLVYHANAEPEMRAEYLRRYLGAMERLKSLTRVAHEGKMLTHSQNDRLSEMYDSAGRQAAAWRRKSMQSARQEKEQQT